MRIPGWLAWLRPARSVPVTRWRSPGRWSPRPASLVVLLVGLWTFGTGEAMLVRSGLGVSPWTVLAQGLSVVLPMNIGAATFLVSAVVLLLWIPLRERPGLGTVANALVIAVALQVGVTVLPQPGHWPGQLAVVLGGIALVGWAAACTCPPTWGPAP